MKLNCDEFKSESDKALHNQTLQQALANLKTGFVNKRAQAIQNLPEFYAIRENAVAIKNHTLEHLDYYLTLFEQQVAQRGGQVHWALDAEQACNYVLDICKQQNARRIAKSKSMLTQEIALNDFLEANGLSVVETDLGEYILQLRHENPSHIVAPAIHLVKQQIAETFYQAHALDPERSLKKREDLLTEARHMLREQFLNAEIGITGANFLIAETGSTAIVTNEGNGDLTQILPNTHIVIAGIDKIVPTLEDSSQILRLLTRSATGQEITSYVTYSTGPRRVNDIDGPNQFHVILVDNGRSKMLGSEFQDMLRCIRCAACLNHCPVYDAVGGRAYGSVYPGPMGAVLTPSLFGIEQSRDLPNASTFCGRCEQVCPMKIPLPKMMRAYREQEFVKKLPPIANRYGIKFWAWFAKHPFCYHFMTKWMNRFLLLFGKKKGRFQHLPFASGWTRFRDFPAPSNKTFHELWLKETKK